MRRSGRRVAGVGRRAKAAVHHLAYLGQKPNAPTISQPAKVEHLGNI
jgi:hypothetical protein